MIHVEKSENSYKEIGSKNKQKLYPNIYIKNNVVFTLRILEVMVRH